MLSCDTNKNNPISPDKWVKHFYKIYVEGIDGTYDHQYIQEETIKWNEFMQNIDNRRSIYFTTFQAKDATFKDAHSQNIVDIFKDIGNRVKNVYMWLSFRDTASAGST